MRGTRIARPDCEFAALRFGSEAAGWAVCGLVADATGSRVGSLRVRVIRAWARRSAWDSWAREASCRIFLRECLLTAFVLVLLLHRPPDRAILSIAPVSRLLNRRFVPPPPSPPSVDSLFFRPFVNADRHCRISRSRSDLSRRTCLTPSRDARLTTAQLRRRHRDQRPAQPLPPHQRLDAAATPRRHRMRRVDQGRVVPGQEYGDREGPAAVFAHHGREFAHAFLPSTAGLLP